MGLTTREVDYLIEQEFARGGEDVLWRRSKLGLYLTDEQRAEVGRYVEHQLLAQSSAPESVA